MPNLVGQTLLNRYQVLELIGRGGMAEVYKVYDKERATHLALKLLRDDLAQDPVFLRRFRREAQTLAKLQHPNIVRFYGFEQDGDLAFMLLDYVEGRSLKRLIFDHDGPLPMETILTISQQVLSALGYAHRQGFMHAGIKPGNILIDNRVMQPIYRWSEYCTATYPTAIRNSQNMRLPLCSDNRYSES